MKNHSFSDMAYGMLLGALGTAFAGAVAMIAIVGALLGWNHLMHLADSDYPGALDSLLMPIPPISSVVPVFICGVVLGAITGGARLSRG